MESFDYLKGIRESNHYELALLTTYNFEVGFFESFILNSLFSIGVKKVSVFADGRRLAEALENVRESFIGKRYVVNPIRLDAAFHPKLILLLGQNAAKLYVSSANLTTSGICINNEIVNEFVFDANHPENLKVISQAISFFEKLDTLSYGQDRGLFDEIRNLPYYGMNNVNQSLYLLDSIDEPLLDQIQRIIQTANEIDIAVPYCDNGVSVIEELINRFPNADIRVWLQNGKSRFPMWKSEDRRFAIMPYRTISSVYDGKTCENERFYHGKVFRFKNAEKSFVVYGSANCTNSAFALSHKNGGNIECDILEAGEPEEFDSFFSGFIKDDTELSCDELSDNTPEYSRIHFMYGEIRDSKAVLSFGCSQLPKHLSVCIEDTKLPLYVEAGRIEVMVEETLLARLPEVFSVVFFSEEGLEEVRCWILYKDYLELFRLQEDSEGVFAFDFNSSDDMKYRQDRYALLSAYSLSVKDILREHEVEKHFQRVLADPDPDNNDDDDGIIDYTPPSIDIIRQHKIIGRIRQIESIFRDSFISWVAEASRINQPGKSTHSSPTMVETVHLSPDQDRSFIRFVEAQFKKLMNADYQAKVDPERFYSAMLVFFDIFDKYTVFYKKEHEETLMSPLFTGEAKMLLLSSIKKMRVSKEISDNLTVLTFLAIVINHMLNTKDRDRRIDTINQKLLASVPQDEDFRKQGYMERVITVVDMLAIRSVNLDPMTEIKYIDSLFGYKPLEKIRESIRADYGESCKVIFDNNLVSVEAEVESISGYLTIREGSLRDINNFVKSQGRFDSLFVDIIVRGSSKGPNPAIRVTYSVSNLPSSIVRQKIFRKNGKTEETLKDLRTIPY